MSEFWTSAALWLAQISVVASCLILLTLLLARFTRQPARRQRLCEMGLVAALIAAAVSAAPAWLVIGLPIKAQQTPAADSAAISEDFPDFAFDPVLVADPRQAALTPPALPEPDVQTSPVVPQTMSTAAVIVLGLLVLYGGGTLFFLLRWFRGVLVLRRLLRQTERVPAHVQELLGLAPETGPRLLISRRLRVPISCGIWRPTVVLPIAFCLPRAHARLRCVLAHEMTHIERKDALSAALFALGQAVFFHLPWFWMLRKQVRLCQEYVADASAVADRPADEYAEFLLTLSETKALPLLATGVGGPVSDLFRRVSMLLQNPLRVEKRCPRFWTWGLACVFLALAAMLGGVGLRAAAADTIIIIIPGKQTTEPVKDKTADAKKTEAPTGYFKAIILNDKGAILEKPLNVWKAPILQKPINVWMDPIRSDVPVQAILKDAKKLPPATKEDQEKLKKIIQDLENILKTRPDAKELRDLIDRLKTLKGLASLEKLQNPYQLTYPQDTKKTLYQQGVLPYSQAYPAPVDTKKVVPYLGPGPQGVIPGHPAPWLNNMYPYKPAPGSSGQVDWKKLEKLLEQIQKAPDKVDPKDIRKALEEIRKAAGNAPYWVPVQQFNNLGYDPVAQSLTTKPGTRGRFGIRFSPLTNDLREYLGLPKDRGLLIDFVDMGSPAAKAGLKVRDIVLKLNDQPIPSDANKAAKLFADVKDGTSVNLTVLRKGKEEVIKGIAPTAPETQWIRQTLRQGLIGELEKVPEKGALVTILSDGGKFTVKQREKQLTITIKGTFKDGKAANLEILIQLEGKEAFRGTDLKSVPEAWRQRVQRLLELARIRQPGPQSRTPAQDFYFLNNLPVQEIPQTK